MTKAIRARELRRKRLEFPCWALSTRSALLISRFDSSSLAQSSFFHQWFAISHHYKVTYDDTRRLSIDVPFSAPVLEFAVDTLTIHLQAM
jgi:hypothetical protein